MNLIRVKDLKIVLAFLILFITSITTSYSIYAGGGFVTITSGDNPGVINSRPVHLYAIVSQSLFNLSPDLLGKKVALEVRAKSTAPNPPSSWAVVEDGSRPSGATCVTSPTILNANTNLSATCTGTDAGWYFVSMNVYSGGDDKAPAEVGGYTMHFLATAPPTPTPKVTFTPTPTLTPVPTASPIPTATPKPTLIQKILSPSIWEWLRRLFLH